MSEPQAQAAPSKKRRRVQLSDAQRAALIQSINENRTGIESGEFSVEAIRLACNSSASFTPAESTVLKWLNLLGVKLPVTTTASAGVRRSILASRVDAIAETIDKVEERLVAIESRLDVLQRKLASTGLIE